MNRKDWRVTQPSEPRWLLLIHQIPPVPAYLRVKIGRRLQQVGAIAIKNSVYCLPNGEQAHEDLQWVVREIGEGGGNASIVEARFIDGLSGGDVEGLFRAARDADYAAVSEAARRLGDELAKGAKIDADLARLRKRMTEIEALDFFVADGRQTAGALVAELEKLVEPAPDSRERKAPRKTVEPGRTWVTRKGVKVDRIASAWLIRSFIDPRARFKFVAGQGYRPRAGELRFDMFEGEYTHEGDRCTFEVLVQRFGLDNPALHRVAEVVHDVDLKDGKFGRAEAAGIERLVAGLAAATQDDDARLAQGAPFFACLRESFARSGE
jgi:hypothetical protein